MIIDGLPLDELSSAKLSEIVRYGKYDARIRSACQTELWRREQGRDGTRAPESADEVNRLLTETKRR